MSTRQSAARAEQAQGTGSVSAAQAAYRAQFATRFRSEAMSGAPYKGLVPYGEEDAGVFFGRDAERSIIVANLRSSRFTLLYGPSGVGKSSVVSAGAAHYLRQRAKQNLQKRGTPEFAVVVFKEWRDNPVAGLLTRVRETVESLLDKKFNDGADFTSKNMDEQLKTWAERAGGDLLIILDQFEDYFLYHPGEDGPGTFAVEFPQVVTDRAARVNFLASIREDAVAKLDKFEGRIPTLFDNYIRIDHLDRAAAQDAIVKPIEQFNKTVADPNLRMQIEPALVEAVLDQVKTGRVSMTETGAGRLESPDARASATEDAARIETPFLQLVMTRLWDEEVRAGSHVLRLETLNKLGGAERIVRTHLDKAMNALPAGERDAAARVFHYLVTPSGTKIAHTARDLSEYVGIPEKKLIGVLEKLSGTGIRILRPVAPPPDQVDAPPRYEIFHDVLAPSMLDWRRRYMQQRRNRLIQGAAGAVGLGILLVIGLLLFNLQQSQQQLQQKAQEAQSLSQAILSQPTSEAAETVPATLVAIRATAAAVGTSSAAVACQGAPQINFSASSGQVSAGQSVTLQWDQPVRVSGVSIAPEIGPVALQGSQAVEPGQTTTYTLTATGCGGTTTRTVTVTVVGPTALPTATRPPTALPSPTQSQATATRRPPTATPPPPTATQLAAPPGVYVTGMRVDPANPRAGQPILFHVSFVNTMDRAQLYNWCVVIWKPENYPDPRRSDGISTCSPREIPQGTSELEAPGWNVARIGGCEQKLAKPVHLDPAGARIPFDSTDGKDLFLDFNLCP